MSRQSRSPSPDLHYGSFTNSLASLTSRAREDDEGHRGEEGRASSPRCQRAHLAVAVLCYINLLNYMERYTIAGSTVARHTHTHTHRAARSSVRSHDALSLLFCRCPPQNTGILWHRRQQSRAAADRYDPLVLTVVLFTRHRQGRSLSLLPVLSNTPLLPRLGSASRAEQCSLCTKVDGCDDCTGFLLWTQALFILFDSEKK